MATLIELVNNDKTDKNTTHSYLGLYETLLSPIRQTAKNVLEIGVGQGGSIKLWHDYFPNATVYGVDISPKSSMWEEIQNNPRIVLHGETDAYASTDFLPAGIKFDFILDDGPHTYKSMKSYVEMYSGLLAKDGIMVLEDIQEMHWTKSLEELLPDYKATVYDLRNNKGRYDDIVMSFTI